MKPQGSTNFCCKRDPCPILANDRWYIVRRVSGIVTACVCIEITDRGIDKHVPLGQEQPRNIFYIVQGNEATPESLLIEAAERIISLTEKYCGERGHIAIPEVI